jgi:hypothetical protein
MARLAYRFRSSLVPLDWQQVAGLAWLLGLALEAALVWLSESVSSARAVWEQVSATQLVLAAAALGPI